MQLLRALCLILLSTLALFAQSARLPQTPTSPATKDSSASVPSREQIVSLYQKLPIAFAPNQGQEDESVQFLARGAAFAFYLTPGAATLSLAQPPSPSQRDQRQPAERQEPGVVSNFYIELDGANRAAAVSGEEKLPGVQNYYVGNNSSKWVADIPTYARVRYHDVYPGIDLVYYGNQQQLEHDFIVSPGADPSRIRMRFPRASALKKTAAGDLELESAGRRVLLQKPVVYQEVNGEKRPIAAEYASAQGTASFQLAGYDHNLPLIIDPVLAFAFSIGGFGSQIFGVAVDFGGLAYVTGETENFRFTPVNAEQSTYGGGLSDAFVAVINPWFSKVLYATFLGGSGTDVGNAIAVDNFQNAYVTGMTQSTNFPVKNAAQSTPGGGGSDGFVTKFSPTGALLFSTFLGGNGDDQGNGIAVDSKHNIYITGSTSSSNFPTRNPIQATLGNILTCSFCPDAFVTKMNTNGAIVYSTYLGGNNNDVGNAIAVDSSGAAYITGYTNSTNFPTQSPLQAALATSTRGGSLFGADAFVTKLNSAGSAMVYSTYFGGDGDDSGNGIAVDSSGNAYIAGTTGSDNLTTLNPLKSTFTNGCPPNFVGDCGADGMVFKLNSNGSALVYSTYLAGKNGLTQATAIAINSAGNAFITGATQSTSFPTHNAVQAEGSGVLFKSINGGANFAVSNLGLRAGSTTSIAIDPATPSTLYASQSPNDSIGSGGGGISKSTDSGAHWTSMSTGLTSNWIRRVIIDPKTTSILYAAALSNVTKGGVFKSVAGGSWTLPTNTLTNTNVPIIVIDPATTSTLYAVASGHGAKGVFKSTDSAATWTASSSGLPTAASGFFITALVIDPSTRSTLYAGVQTSSSLTSGVYKSTNGGALWVLSAGGLTNTFVESLAIDPTKPSTLYAGTDSGYFVTTNGATSWTAGNSLFNFDMVTALAVDPGNSSHLLLGDNVLGGELWQSTNGGSLWSQTSLQSAPVNTFVFDRATPGNVYAGSNTGSDMFVTELGPTGNALVYSTYFGGSGFDAASAIAFNSLVGGAYVGGVSNSTDLPAVGAASVHQVAAASTVSGAGVPGTVAHGGAQTPSGGPPGGQGVLAIFGPAPLTEADLTMTIQPATQCQVGETIAQKVTVINTSQDFAGGLSFGEQEATQLLSQIAILGSTPRCLISPSKFNAICHLAELSPGGSVTACQTAGSPGCWQITTDTVCLRAGSAHLNFSVTADNSFFDADDLLGVDVAVAKGPTTTALVSSPNPSSSGQTVTLTAKVSGGGVTPTGSVTFTSKNPDGTTTTLGTVTLSLGSAVQRVTFNTAGQYSITAAYSGDSNYTGSTSPVVVQTVN